MEPIRITDKLTLRQEALRMAVGYIESGCSADFVIKTAKDFESYLLGNADLPEYEDTHKDFKEMLGKMQESFTTPRPMWISVDGDIKPPHDADILGYEDGSMHFCKLTKVGDEDVFIINDGCEFHPTHWMPKPIPPFTQPPL